MVKDGTRIGRSPYYVCTVGYVASDLQYLLSGAAAGSSGLLQLT